tara:strand:+ start:2560 stop:2925 length:366 start_codon:yes stop_codon:yes gene_type:complete
VQRKAERENVGSLSYKFWNKTQKKEYTRQVQSVSKLISTFGESAVFDYIINISKRVYSASPKWVKDEIAKHKKYIDKQPKKDYVKVAEVNKENITSQPRKTFGRKTLFTKLRNHDGENKEG